jgi:diguanylate cyclase (GGDEF)-like protein
MTFRARLKLFFAIIVIVPMIAIGLVLFLLAGDSERGKADAALATSMRVAQSLYADGRRAARDDLARLASDAPLRRALARRDHAAATARLRVLVRSAPGIAAVTLEPANGRGVRVGSPRAVAPAVGRPRAADGGSLGTLAVSVTDARELVRTAARSTGEGFLVLRAGRALASTDPAVRSAPASPGDYETAGGEYRGTRARPDGAPEELAVFTEAGGVNTTIRKKRLLIGAILAVFLLVALASSMYVVRALHDQVDRLLTAAKRLGSGEFGHPVPAEGHDELAQLGREFNNMSRQLEEQVREMQSQREELEQTIRRVGDAFATGLDRQGILQLTVQTAVDACRAEFGRALPLDSTALEEAQAGQADPVLARVLEAAEREAFAVGPETGAELLEALEEGTPSQRDPVAVARDSAHGVAMPVRARLGPQATAEYVGVISIARRGMPFSHSDLGMLKYLAVQAVVSVENADLHETVQWQALTDELTGLANVREMYGALDRELERGRRFEAPVGFVMLDIDDFKQINDRYGHQQGDEVLNKVADVLRRLSRDIDEPARYGGEELAVVLPQTDVDGAAMLAERMRVAVQELRIPLVAGEGEIGVTASFGAASVPANASDRAGLVAAADAALYRAKRAGKNQVVRAEAVPTGA